MTFSPLIIWAKGPFFFEQLFSVVARTWLGTKSVRLFLDPKFQFCKISLIVLSHCVQVPLSFDSRVVRSIQSRCKRNVATKRILVTFLLKILHFRRTWTASQVQSKYCNSTFKVGQLMRMGMCKKLRQTLQSRLCCY